MDVQNIEPKRRGPRRSGEDAILAAAADCFQRYGLRKTTMDDIARRANLSRATMYRYFASKDAILERISEKETESVLAEIREQLKGRKPVEELLTECLFLSAKIAHKSLLSRLLMEMRSDEHEGDHRKFDLYRAPRKSWAKVIAEALDRHELADDLCAEQIADWLVLSLALLIAKLENEEVGDAELRRFIKRFVLPPIIEFPAFMRNAANGYTAGAK